MQPVSRKLWALAAQPSLGYAFCDIAVLVLPLLTNATNSNKIQTHRPMNTAFLYCCCLSKKAYEAGKTNNFGFEHKIHCA